jgi:hypothetical protein
VQTVPRRVERGRPARFLSCRVGFRRYGGAVRSLFKFPNPVNEVSARLVAGGVVLQCVAFVVFRNGWQLIPLAYGFVARVATGPTLSPLGQFVTRVVTPRLRVAEKLVPGPPKRFAQGIGATLSLGALLAWGLDQHVVAIGAAAAILVAATLESVFAICLGCRMFAQLMRWGVIPPHVCESCNDISGRLAVAARPQPGVPASAKM